MHLWGIRTVAACLLAVLVASLALTAPAGAVGTGDPVITSPTSTSALYDGYTGPFVVDFADAPTGTYDYQVLDVSGPGDPTPVTPVQHYDDNGTGVEPQLRVPALSPGSYRFVISDAATHSHQASLDFTVRSGSAPRCSLLVPSRVRVNARVEKVVGHLSSTCTALHTATADWKVTRGGRTYDYFSFQAGRNTTDTWSLYSSDPVGGYTVVPLSARSTSFADVPQNTPTVVARRDSRLALTGWRSGSDVTLVTSLSVYAASANAFRPWAGRYVSLSYRSCSSCAWHLLRTLTTDSHGQARYRVRASGVREYRVAASGTSLAWEPFRRYLRR